VAYEDYFGYLPLNQPLVLSCGSITPLPELPKVIKWVEKYSNVDGYYYADAVHTRRSHDGGKTFKKVPKSTKPGLLHRLPATHKIELSTDPADQETARYGLAGFLMHMTAFLYGRRCHFYDWWLDGRMSLKSTADHDDPRLGEATHCLEEGFATWSGWPDRQRIVGLNALFLKTRTHSYELEWERFQAEYQVFDALYSIARDVGLVSRVPHVERIPAMCASFGLPMEATCVATIVRLRNDLLHEALWAGRMPGEARGNEAFHSSFWLDHLSSRLTLALLGINGPYVQSPWWGIISGMFRITP